MGLSNSLTLADRASGGARIGPVSNATNSGESSASADESTVLSWLPLPSALAWQQLTPGEGISFLLRARLARLAA